MSMEWIERIENTGSDCESWESPVFCFLCWTVSSWVFLRLFLESDMSDTSACRTRERVPRLVQVQPRVRLGFGG